MKGLLLERYGPPTRVRLAELPTPEPTAGQVRVRVAAAGLNAYDWHLYRGDPFLARIAFGWPRPRPRIVGIDVAGVVEAVGADVDTLGVGDRVAGCVVAGTFAEQVVADAALLARVPDGVALETAAALPAAGLTALQGLRNAGVTDAARVLVIGASGGVGHLAVQLARVLGAARVVAVCSGRNAAHVAALGADRVIDYTRQRVVDAGERFDVVYDTVGTTSLRRLRHLIAPGGVYVPVGGVGGGPLFGAAWTAMAAVPAGRLLRTRVVPASIVPGSGDVAELLRLADAGDIRPVIERVHRLDDHVAAFTRLESLRVAGKLIFAIG